MLLINIKNLLLIMLFSINVITTCQGMCEVAIRQFERKHGIPDKLLMAISLVESGRNIPGRGMVAWPWTINANGKSYVFPTKSQAIAKVRQLQSQGMRSIDVGCMQINLKHHPSAFRNLEEAFDPYVNISYAANFLKQKKDTSGSWHHAVGHYHSAVPHINAPYKSRVLKTWAKVQKCYPGKSAVMSTVWSPDLRHQGEFEMQIQGENGSKTPVMVQFGPYTGLKREKIEPAIVTTVHREVAENTHHNTTKHKDVIRSGAIRGGFFPIHATRSARHMAKKALPSKLLKANYKVSKNSSQKMYALSTSSGRRGFFPLR